MFGFLRRLFGGAAASAAKTPDAPPAHENADALYDEFCQSFCHRPGVNFMDFLKAEGVTRMIDWLRPGSGRVLPAAFIRLAVQATRSGANIWDMPGISLLHQGDGPPDQESLDALSVLAQILGKPIKLFFRTNPGGEPMVSIFQP
jgi:hypothetical protein